MANLPDGFYPKLLEANGIGVVIANARASIVSVNKTATSLTGYSEEELIGKNPRIFQSGITTKATYQDMWAKLKAGRAWSGHVTNRRKNGELYTAYETITPIMSGATAAWYVATQRDVSSEQFLREELARVQGALTRAAEEARVQLPLCDPSLEAPVRGLFRAIQARHEALAAHAVRVWLLADAIAQAIGAYDQITPAQLRTGALLHDVGKLSLADDLLISDEKMPEEGRLARRKHVVVGTEIVSTITQDPVVLGIVRSHHERLDGSGFPDHLLRAEVPLGARIVMVADLFDALSVPLGVREATDPEIVLSSLLAEALAGRFDMVCTRYLADLYRDGSLESILHLTEHEALALVLEPSQLGLAA